MADKEPSQRQLRVAQEIRKIIAQFIDRGEVRILKVSCLYSGKELALD